MIMVWGIDIQYQPERMRRKDNWTREYNPETDSPCIAKALLGLYRVDIIPKYPRYRLVEKIREIDHDTPFECHASVNIWTRILEGRMKVSLTEPYLDQHVGYALCDYVSKLYITPPVIENVWDRKVVVKSDFYTMFPECKDMPFDIGLDYLRERC